MLGFQESLATLPNAALLGLIMSLGVKQILQITLCLSFDSPTGCCKQPLDLTTLDKAL